ncbi:DUF1376 domain-containing protein [Hymenobacter sp. 102]|uniref:DUF1376 domain-containing protein n=1 Tax=Hymenobacter sp. 102 TaxID=3403152 RepID=UPI003CF02B0B
MNKAPAFQLYAGDFLSSPDVQMMDAAEVGAYCLLLFNAWQTDLPGHLPNSEDKLRRLSRLSVEQWQVSREILLSKFPEAPDGATRYNPRLVAEVEKQRVNREKQAANGAKGGRPRKNPTESQINPPLFTENPRLLNQNPTHNPKKALHSSSSISSSIKETPPTPEGCVLSKKNEGGVETEKLPTEVSPASASHTGGAAADVATHIEFRSEPEWAAPMRLLAEQMIAYWGLAEYQQQPRMALTRFCRVLFEGGHGPVIQQQFQAYRAYKELTGERRHEWDSFIGKESAKYQNAEAGWLKTNWVEALATARTDPKYHASSQHRISGGPAASAGRATTLDRESYSGRRPAASAAAA